MPLQKLSYRPGVNREGTDYSNEGGFYISDKVRFRSGQAEKIGGWVQYVTTQFAGICRSLWSWLDLLGLNKFIGIGTSLKFYILSGGAYYDITPIVQTDTLTNPFSNSYSTLASGITASATSLTLASASSFQISGIIKIDSEQISYTGVSGNSLTGLVRGYNGTTATSHSISAGVGCSNILVTDASYHPSIGDYFILGSGYSVDGVTVSGENVVTLTPSLTTYVFQTSGFSTSLVTGVGGTVTVQYEYPTGSVSQITATGWGTGPWGGATSLNNVTLTNPFSTTASSSTITVAQANHGLTTGNWINFSLVSSSVSGISPAVLQQDFQVTVLTSSTYTISTVFGNQTFLANATASSLGGIVTVNIPVVPNRGWNTAYTVTSSSVSASNSLRLWTQDNFGADLALAPRGGPIFYWVDANGLGTRAQYLSSLASAAGYTGSAVPSYTNQVITSPIQQFVITLGSTSYTSNTTFNPMLVRWSDQGNQYQWVPAVTNQSGEFALTNGSYIMCGQTTRQEILIWTDTCLYSMQYIGYPYVWSFQILMDNISIMSPNCAITVNNVTYWMGADKFYAYTGVVSTLPCSLRQYVFDNINQDQSLQVFAGANEGYNEIWWFYCSANSNTIDSYVIYNYLDKVWSYGKMARTAWLQYGSNPIAADYNSRILQHEVGCDDNSTSTTLPITATIQSSDFGIEAGDHLGFVWRLLPDINFNGSSTANPSVTMTLYSRQNSGSSIIQGDIDTVTSTQNYTNVSYYTIQQFTGQVYTRVRGRQLAFNITSTGVGVAWQLGIPRIDIKPAGKR